MPLPPRPPPRMALAKSLRSSAADADADVAEMDQVLTCPACGHEGPEADFQADQAPPAPSAPPESPDDDLGY